MKVVPGPRGRPPRMSEPDKLLSYLKQKAAYQGKNPALVKVPGAEGWTGALEYPGGYIHPEQRAGYVPPKQPTGSAPVSKTDYKLYDGNGVANPTVKQETDEEIIMRISSRFETLRKIVHSICQGKLHSLIVTGAGGLGKTYTVTEIAEHYKEHKNLNVVVVSGGVVTPVNFVKLLWKTRTKGSVLIMDDSDDILDEPEALTLLKGALDTSKVRKVAWMSESHILAKEGIDPIFQYEGAIIFVSNINFQAYIDAGKGKRLPHLQALRTRFHYLDLKLHTDREIVLWIEHMICKNHILVSQKGVTHDQEMEILKWMLAHRTQLASLSIRTALQIADYMTSEGSGWKQLAKDMILK